MSNPNIPSQVPEIITSVPGLPQGAEGDSQPSQEQSAAPAVIDSTPWATSEELENQAQEDHKQRQAEADAEQARLPLTNSTSRISQMPVALDNLGVAAGRPIIRPSRR